MEQQASVRLRRKPERPIRLIVIDTLRQRNFALLWFGGLISAMGSRMLMIALPFYIYQQTGSVLATSIVLMMYWLPGILLGSVAGVFVDRWDRKRMLVVANLLQTVVVLVLLVLVFAPTGEWLWLAYAVNFVQSCIDQFSGPAEGALLPRLVGEERLVPANSLNALNDNIGRLVGAPVGGALLGLFGLGSVVVVDGLTFLFAAVMISLISGPPQATREASESGEGEAVQVAAGRWISVWQEWLEGLRTIKRNRLIVILFVVVAIQTFGNGILSPLLVPFVDDVLGSGAAGYGWLSTAQGIGGLIGGFIVGQWGKALNPSHLIAPGLAAVGLTQLAVFNFPSLPLAIVLFALLAVPFVAALAGQQTLLQTSAADEYRGRVLGASDANMTLFSLGGAVTAGALGNVLGTVPMLNISAGLFILAGLVALLLRGCADRRVANMSNEGRAAV
jgi:predicted MFS family arabinose efflux permease